MTEAKHGALTVINTHHTHICTYTHLVYKHGHKREETLTHSHDATRQTYARFAQTRTKTAPATNKNTRALPFYKLRPRSLQLLRENDRDALKFTCPK